MSGGSKDDRGVNAAGGAPGTSITGMTLQDHVALARAPKRSDRPGWGLAGKIRNAPNTALGLLYGGAGMVAGEVGTALGLQHTAPRIRLRDNAVQFTNTPFPGALTLGNTTVWNGDPYDPNDHSWDGRARLEGHPVPDHERQHTYQGEQLGPLYLPSNVLGGLNAMLHGQDWHGAANWNEQGPKANPPRPWMPTGQR